MTCTSIEFTPTGIDYQATLYWAMVVYIYGKCCQSLLVAMILLVTGLFGLYNLLPSCLKKPRVVILLKQLPKKCYLCSEFLKYY